MTENETRIPVDLLNLLFDLDKDTGTLRWRERPVQHFRSSKNRTATHVANNWNSRNAGMIALNSVDASGHMTGRINNLMVFAHRVVYAMTHGGWPSKSIDHINGIPSDNRPCNLRDVTHIDNHRNQALRKNNTSGHIGVSFNKRLGKWMAHITIRGQYNHVGYFDRLEAAISARKSAEIAHGFHKNHGRNCHELQDS